MRFLSLSFPSYIWGWVVNIPLKASRCSDEGGMGAILDLMHNMYITLRHSGCSRRKRNNDEEETRLESGGWIYCRSTCNIKRQLTQTFYFVWNVVVIQDSRLQSEKFNPHNFNDLKQNSWTEKCFIIFKSMIKKS